MPILILDVSHWQGVMNWDVAKSKGVRGAIIKASEGTTWRDPQFDRNVDGLRKAGLPFGAYHFFLPTLDVTGQAENLLRAADGIPINLGFWGDFELESISLDKYSVSNRSYNFMQKIADGNKAGEYTSPGYSNSYFVTNDNPPKPDMRHAEFPSWLANYTTQSYPMLPDIGIKPLIWQFSSGGNGYYYGASSERIDLNYWMGTEEEFNAFAGITDEIVIPPVENSAVLFKAKCIQPVDTRNELGVDIKMDLAVGDLVDVFEINADQTMWRIAPLDIQRWVVSSPNYMQKIEPVVEPPVVDDKSTLDKLSAWFADHVKGF